MLKTRARCFVKIHLLAFVLISKVAQGIVKSVRKPTSVFFHKATSPRLEHILLQYNAAPQSNRRNQSLMRIMIQPCHNTRSTNKTMIRMSIDSFFVARKVARVPVCADTGWIAPKCSRRNEFVGAEKHHKCDNDSIKLLRSGST